MSVHSEYSRTLEAMIDRLQALDHGQRETWIAQLEAARVGSQPDLSAAAAAAQLVLAAIAADTQARSVEGLVDPRVQLDAHCRAILGN